MSSSSSRSKPGPTGPRTRYRANLDATLRLIDQENPSKSELLASTLRAHGDGQRTRPIFPGSNDRAYQILSTWVQSLRRPQQGGEQTRPQSARNGDEDAENFAVGRNRIAADGSVDTLSALPDGGQRRPSAVPPSSPDPTAVAVRPSSRHEA